jgi:hypothetical protein
MGAVSDFFASLSDRKTWPWWLNSATIKSIAVIGCGVAGHLSKHAFNDAEIQRYVDIISSGLEVFGMVFAIRGRAQKEKDSNNAIVKAAETGTVPMPVAVAVTKQYIADTAKGKK